MWTEGKELKTNALDLCIRFLGGAWSQATPEEITVERLSGGLSNHVYLCCLPDHVQLTAQEPRKILLRVYGKTNTDANSITTETAIFMLLSERKLGPKLYGIFPNGRLEEYIPSRCMTWDDLRQPQTAIAVAKEFARVHSLEVPIEKKPTWIATQMQSWLDFLRNNTTLEDLKPSDKKIAAHVLNLDLEKEVRWLDSEMKQTGSPSVFSHNDLQGGNILLPQSAETPTDKPVVFIDFEYGSYNYRGFDIGNHFCERCYSYTEENFPFFASDLERFPTEDEQLQFINAYIEETKAIHPDSSIPLSAPDIMREVKVFVIAAHMLWSLWGYYMALTSTVNFGYWEFVKVRLEFYWKLKIRFFGSLDDLSPPHLDNGVLSS